MDAQSNPSLIWSRQFLVLMAGTLFFVLAIIATNLLFLADFRENSLQSAEADLSRDSLTLAEQTDRSFQSVDLVLSSVGDYLGRKGANDAESYRRLVTDYDSYLFLKEKITGLPQIDAVTLIDADGNLLNFSRSWPIPKVNVADRDYFKALAADPALESYVSAPVPNRADGTWDIYVARRLNDPNGNFMGLILGAISLQYFENFFGVTSFGEGSSVSFVREDGMLLARFPHSDNVGLQTKGGVQRALLAGGIIRDEDWGKPATISSARTLPNYPLSIKVTQTEASVLIGWRHTAALLLAMSAALVFGVFIGAYFLTRWWRARERATHAAEAANRAKSAFLAMMSHEIRTPMNAVLGLASTLLESKLDADQRETISAIYNAGDSLLEILNDILDFSKLESGKVSLEAVAFSPASLVHNAVSILRPRATAKGLSIRVHEDLVLPPALMGDAGRVRQMLLNLMSNAVKFTETGEVAMSVRCLHRDQGSATIEWSVSDTGIGIPADRLKELFKDFTQADSSISRRFGGSGLGLAICKRLAEQMGGEIGVTSVAGQGSTFRLTLTLKTAEQASLVERDNEDHSYDLAGLIATLDRPLRILITDDNATNRLVAANMLKEFNVQAMMACNGIEAVEAASRFPHDVILMDMRMPEMDGLQATRAIRKLGGPLANIPIIAFTANAFAEDITACNEAGMNDFIVKPMRKKVLVETISRALVASFAPAGLIAVEAAPTAPNGECAEDADAVGAIKWGDSTLPVVDRAALETLIDEIGEETARELFEVFRNETLEAVASFKSLSCPADHLQIQREAHALKSASATFGLRRLSALARTMEIDAARLTNDDFRTGLDRIEKAFEAALAHMPALASVAG